MVIAIEAWTIPMEGDEEPCVEELVEVQEFPVTLGGKAEAMRFAFQKLEEGFFVKLWRR